MTQGKATRPVYIYAMTDPRTGTTRYIGQSRSPRQRYRSHISESLTLNPSSRTQAWISELVDLGLLPQFAIIDEVCESDAGEIERDAMMAYLLAGADLVNEFIPTPSGGRAYLKDIV